MILEICAANLNSALNAQECGAHRIELCQDLHLDGLTPGVELLREVRKKLRIPVFVLIRTRPGNFVYTRDEFQEMLDQIDLAKKMGCDGIVSGVLTSEGEIDVIRTSDLIDRTSPLPFTFHRAFDQIKDWKDGLDSLIALGASRVLTSGSSERAISGLDRLMKLKTKAKDKLIVMPGGGVRPEDVSKFAEFGFTELHSSAMYSVNSEKSPEDVSDCRIIRRFANEFSRLKL